MRFLSVQTAEGASALHEGFGERIGVGPEEPGNTKRTGE